MTAAFPLPQPRQSIGTWNDFLNAIKQTGLEQENLEIARLTDAAIDRPW